MPVDVDFASLFKRSPNPYMVLDRELRYVAANDAYLRVTGATLEGLVGRLFKFSLRTLEPFGALPSDDVCEAAAGDGMNPWCRSDALSKDGCRREERGQCQSLEVLH